MQTQTAPFRLILLVLGILLFGLAQFCGNHLSSNIASDWFRLDCFVGLQHVELVKGKPAHPFVKEKHKVLRPYLKPNKQLVFYFIRDS